MAEDDRKDYAGDAPWAAPMAHKPDPNRVSSLQTPSPGTAFDRPGVLPPDPSTSTASLVPARGVAASKDPARPRDAEPAYYDISPLKPSLWKWEIAVYFFLGGISGAAHLIGRTAARCGGSPELTRTAATVSLLSLLPCPPLLIHDLGDPKRFHHMLRVFKPGSPMNLGTWVISAFSGAAANEFARHYLTDERVNPADRTAVQKLLNSGTVLLVQDAVGVPMALLLASYTGVLLSTSSNPLWAKNVWLSPLFTASAVSTGCEALMLALDYKRGAPDAETPTMRGLRRLDTLAHAVELACVAGFNKAAGERAKTLHTGEMRNWHRTSMAGILGAEAVKLLPLPRTLDRPRRRLASTLGLIGGFALRWAMVLGGVHAAADPRTARLVSKPGSRPA